MQPAEPFSTEPIELQARLDYTIPGRFRIVLELNSVERLNVLTGPSGSGKSTILKLISGWIESNAIVKMNGKTIHHDNKGKNLPLARLPVGMVFQDDLLFPHLDVQANVEFGLRRRGGRSAINEIEFQRLIDSFGINTLLKSRVQLLSGGERQRVGLVRALACRPKLLLCDEPVSAIDRTSRREIVGRLVDWVEETGACLIYVTHDPEEIELLGQNIWRIDNGQLCS
ncbi:MAG: ATP-binding cassette domain-containing protein [bacterium]